MSGTNSSGEPMVSTTENTNVPTTQTTTTTTITKTFQRRESIFVDDNNIYTRPGGNPINQDFYLDAETTTFNNSQEVKINFGIGMNINQSSYEYNVNGLPVLYFKDTSSSANLLKINNNNLSDGIYKHYFTYEESQLYTCDFWKNITQFMEISFDFTSLDIGSSSTIEVNLGWEYFNIDLYPESIHMETEQMDHTTPYFVGGKTYFSYYVDKFGIYFDDCIENVEYDLSIDDYVNKNFFINIGGTRGKYSIIFSSPKYSDSIL